MFNIYMKGFNQNGRIINEETLVQTIPADKEGDLKLISPIVKGEMGNAESFNFNIENGTKFYDAFQQMKTYIRVTYENTNIFYGRVLAIDEGFHGTRKIRCEGPLSFLLDSPIEGTEENDRKTISVGRYLEKLVENHNSYLENDPNRSFSIGNAPGHYGFGVSEEQKIEDKSRKFGADSWSDSKGAIEDLRSHYGGYLRARLTGAIGSSIALDWMNHYFNSSINTQTIEVGKNIIDLNTSTEVDNIFTAIIPVGNSHTEKGAKHFYIDGKVLKVPDICSKYGQALNSGYHRYEDYATAVSKYGLIIKVVSFDDAENKTELYDKACEWIKNNYQGEVIKFSVKAIDMHQIGDSSVSKILVGDRVNIIYPVGSEEGTMTKKTISLTCMSIQYDLYNPENNQYTFGIPANIMTKSYGLHKQSKSTTAGASSGGRSGSTGTGKAAERDWLDEVRQFLVDHLIFYGSKGGPLPYEPKYNSYMDGPFAGKDRDTRNYFISFQDTLVGNYALWKFTPTGTTTDSAYSQETYDHYMEVDPSGASAKLYKDMHSKSHTWRYELMYIDRFTSDYVIEFNIIDYVKEEYGIDIRTGLAVKMPGQLTLSNGQVIYTAANAEGDMITAGIFKMPEGSTINDKPMIVWTDPKKGLIASIYDSSGNIHYYSPNPDDPEGPPVEVNLRELTTDTIKTNEEVGSLIVETLDKKDPFVYHLTLSVEKFLQAQLVTARVEGDTVILGNLDDPEHHGTSQQIRAAVENISDVCGDFSVETDPLTGKRTLVIKDGTGMAMTRDGAQFGVFDDGNLTGGVIVNKVNDGSTQTTIRGDRVDITSNNNFVNLTVGVNGIQQTVNKHTVDITNQQEAISNVDQRVLLIEGSALWTQRDSITGVAGQFEVHKDAQGNERIVIVSGGGMTIKENGTEYGVYSSYTLTGGIIVDKINADTTTKIVGTNVDIKASQIAGLGFYNDEKLTAGYLIEKINGDTEASIKADRVTISGTTKINDVFTVTDLGLVHIHKNAVIGGTASNSVHIQNGMVSAHEFRIIGHDSDEHYDFDEDSILSFIKKAEVDGNNLKLWKVSDSINPSITFSKATTLTGAWGSGTDAETFIVTASPQGNTYKFSPPLRLDGTTANSNFSAQIYETPSGGTPVAKKSVYGYLIFNDSKASSTVTVNTKSDGSGSSVASISIGSLYTSGKTDGAASINISKGSWVSGVCSFTRTSSGGKTSDEVRLCYKWDGTDVQIWDGQSADAEHGSYTNYKIDVSGKLETKELTENNKTYTPSSGNIGFSSVSVNVPTGAGGDKARFNSAPGGVYFIEAYENASGTSVAGSSMNYQLKAIYKKENNVITQEVQIQDSSGNKLSNTAVCPIWLAETTLDNNKFQGLLAYDKYYAISSGSTILAMWQTPSKISADYDLKSVGQASSKAFPSSSINSIFSDCDEYMSVSLPAASTNNYRGIIMNVDGHKFGCYFSN